MSNKHNTILLPSFLRRCLNAFAIKLLIRNTGAQLQRQGRSRQWQLTASTTQIFEIIEQIEQSEQQSWLWVAKKLKEQSKSFHLSAIKQIVKLNPQISVNELVAKTNCTVAQARQAIDDVEFEH